MGSRPSWKLNMLAKSLSKKDLYINRLESVIFSTEMCICVFYIPELNGKERPHGTKIKFLKFKIELYQRIEIKEYMRKIG